jgi:hypothetical protein
MGKQLNALMFKFENEGDKITGIVTGIDYDFEIPNSPNEGKCNRYHVMDDEGISYSFILGTATDKSLENADLKGKRITAEFKGKVAISGGRSVNQFIVSEADEKPKKSKE